MGKTSWVALAVAAALATACSVGSNEPTKPLFRKVPAPEIAASCQLPMGSGTASGLGDPYYPADGAPGIDVQKYDLKLRYEPATDKLTGTALLTIKATQPLSTIYLDFTGMTVEQVLVNDVKAEATREQAELRIKPATAVSADSTFTVKITYSGVPEEEIESDFGANGFLHTADGAFVMGEPHSATTWFPANDHPRDKALYDIEVTHPANLVGITNGVRKGQSTKDGLMTSQWQVTSPMATYLATLAIGDYRVTETTYEGKPVINAIHNSITNTQVDKDLARNGEVIDFLASKFGPYPFDALGGVVVNDDRIGFALETQTRPMYSFAFWARGSSNTSVISHELAHQWFGDSVSLDNWQNIWLNEGFASYAQWMWTESDGGVTAQQEFDRRYASQSSPIWSVAPGCPGSEELFGSSTYNRGPMVLHMLRKTVGEDKFIEILKTWVKEKRDGNAKISEFIDLSEKISGQQLDDMFNAWLFTKSRPS